MKPYSPFVISSAALLLWILIVTPVLCGLFGSPLPINLRDSYRGAVKGRLSERK
jgi:hypothetical protein